MIRSTLALVSVLFVAGCGDGVSSSEEAARAYQGLDASIDKAISLGLDGFNGASSANIAPQTGKGAKTGTITITGKVDQGSSSNKTMNLEEALAKYSDDEKVTYDTTAGALPTIDIKLSKVPDGTLDGTLNGAFTMTGELEGTVTLALAFTGDLEPTAADPAKVQRKAGSTHITGTATSEFGTFEVDLTR